ncbi:MAG TPA: alternative ribosome rescue aminoacyl-tRNA hydrolase ArfB [Steroidobacteraceae bacterium]|nr:alternative ribosome rescue aminoacyl-tRNA hydrolase ArfB [Steroidobacteraceae bacterium]
MAIEIRPGLTIPDEDLEVTAIRASGPGGQNVNKVSSAIQLRFSLANNETLRFDVKTRLRSLAGTRLNLAGDIVIVARTQRSRERNLRDAEERLRQLILEALTPPKPRYATRPTRASKERRLQSKTLNQRTKKLRSRVRHDD